MAYFYPFPYMIDTLIYQSYLKSVFADSFLIVFVHSIPVVVTVKDHLVVQTGQRQIDGFATSEIKNK